MAEWDPFDHDPFDGMGPAFMPVDHDPFADSSSAADAAAAAAARTRSAVMPDRGRQEGGLTQFADRFVPALPTIAGHMAMSLATLPQRVGEESKNLRLGGTYDPGPAMEAALLTLGVPRTIGARGPLGIYNPPTKPLRPFEADYPAGRWAPGALANASGRLTADIEGRPLTAEHVVGRRVVGRHDEAFPPAQLNAIAKTLTGRSPETLAPSEIGGSNAGVTTFDPNTRRPKAIYLNSALAADDSQMVLAHEVGHAIDEIAGNISARGHSRELTGVYNTLNNPKRLGDDAVPGKAFRPQDLGYKGADVDREYVVEAIRAYLFDPNYLKTVAPNVAAAIREVVNKHPELSKILQFNAVAGTAYQLVPVDRDPSAPPQPAAAPE